MSVLENVQLADLTPLVDYLAGLNETFTKISLTKAAGLFIISDELVSLLISRKAL